MDVDAFWVPSPQCWAFHWVLKVSSPRSLVLSRVSSHLPPPNLHISIHSANPLGFFPVPPPRSCSPFFLVSPLPSRFFPTPASHDYFLHPFKWDWSILTWDFIVKLPNFCRLYPRYSVLFGLYPFISEDILCMSFCVWVTSHKMIFSSSVHLPEKLKMFSFLITE